MEGEHSGLAAAKFVHNDTAYRNETIAYTALKGTNACPNIIDIDYRSNLIISEWGVRAKPKSPYSLSKDHFRQLLNQLKIIHSHGLVHTDVRLSNIILVEEGNSVKFCDFGSVQKRDRYGRVFYIGSRETASQNILIRKIWHIQRTSKFPFKPVFEIKDDYESLLKCFIIWQFNLDIQWKDYKDLFNLWEDFLHSFFAVHRPNTEDEYVGFLEKLFADVPGDLLEFKLPNMVPSWLHTLVNEEQES
jgi:serine/threonine protein kinase